MPKIPADLQVWIDASKRYRLSHAQVQMARELGRGSTPRKFGGLNNHKQEPWKLPLPQFIEQIYLKRFGKAFPDEVVTIEERAKRLAAKKAARKAARAAARPEEAKHGGSDEVSGTNPVGDMPGLFDDFPA